MISTPDRSRPGPSDAPAADPQAVVAELQVEGMHCGSCVALVEEQLTEQPGVTSASVDLDSARAVVEYDSTVVGPDQLRAVIAEAGYSAAPVS